MLLQIIFKSLLDVGMVLLVLGFILNMVEKVMDKDEKIK